MPETLPLEVPPKDWLKNLLEVSKTFDNSGRAEALVATQLFSGIRISEFRGLKRPNLDLKAGKIRVIERADEFGVIGPCKTKNSHRTVPIPPAAVSALRRWIVAAPTSKLGLVFPNGIGKVESYANIYNRLWCPLMAAAGLADVLEDRDPNDPQTVKRKIRPWFGIHDLRHAAVSLWIEQGTKPKKVMAWAGHASVHFTMDTYGHLWPDDDEDQAIVKGAENSILNS